MANVAFQLVKTDEDIQEVAVLANEIWHQHFIPIIGEAQVEYMVEKFQSYPAMKEQIAGGYEYYKIIFDGNMVGYTGIHQEEEQLFLSKLYIHEKYRGNHLATKAIEFLASLCKERKLPSIYLTCNKYNNNTIAIYKHLGFEITDDIVTDIEGGFVMDDYVFTLYV